MWVRCYRVNNTLPPKRSMDIRRAAAALLFAFRWFPMLIPCVFRCHPDPQPRQRRRAKGTAKRDCYPRDNSTRTQCINQLPK